MGLFYFILFFIDYCFFFFNLIFVLICCFRLFIATGLSEPLSLSACACALRKVCEEASAVIYEPCNLDILMWIGEVNHICYHYGRLNQLFITL